MNDFPKKYQAQLREKAIQKEWEEKAVYQWQNDKSKEETFVIDTPPPTVSGLLHMGHIFSYCQADFIARYQRMKGKDVFYPMGFDDNGLPTERLVEKVKKVKGSRLPRKEFVEMCKEVVLDAEKDFKNLFQSIALSVDWHQKYQTISDKTRKISQLSFVELYKKGLLERKYEPCYWCVEDQTALAQADIIDRELPSKMIDIEFKIEGGGSVVIATTRPELLAACIAVFVHPEDDRYKNLVGKNAITPLYQQKIKIIADDLVDKEKGTGAVMCCSFGDMSDVIWWKKYNLENRTIISKYGKICSYLELTSIFINNNGIVGDGVTSAWTGSISGTVFKEEYQKIAEKKVFEARNIVLARLAKEKLIKGQKDIVHSVKCSERSEKPIEIIATKQWFVKILDKKEELLKKVQEINWYPAHMKIRIEQWIEGLAYDWCISRQRFFGVPFPVWYCFKLKTERIGEVRRKEDEIIVEDKDLPFDPLYNLPEGYREPTGQEIEFLKDEQKEYIKNRTINTDKKEFVVVKKDDKNEQKQFYLLIPETDVMDTWATSSLTPQISSQGINEECFVEKEKHKKLFPADLRPQAHEIIRSWAFYTICKAHLHQNLIPWKDVMISGWCLAADKTKMSKSKGNVITPVKLIEEKGADVVRYWAGTSSLGADAAYSEDLLSIGKKLINKLWNSSKFANTHLVDFQKLEADKIYHQTDLWILNLLQEVKKKVEKYFAEYRYSKALSVIDDFFLKNFCDYYLEISKVRIYGNKEQIELTCKNLNDNEIEQGKASAKNTLYIVLKNILKLYAPFLPHITEELYKLIFKKEHSIHSRGNWLDLSDLKNIKKVDFSNILEIIDKIRKDKADKNYSIKKEIKKLIIKSKNKIETNNDLKFVCSIKKIEFYSADKEGIEIIYE